MKNNAYNMRYISIHARTMDPSFAQRDLSITQIHRPRCINVAHRVGRKKIRFAKVNKVDIFYGIVLIQLACSSFLCTLSLD